MKVSSPRVFFSQLPLMSSDFPTLLSSLAPSYEVTVEQWKLSLRA